VFDVIERKGPLTDDELLHELRNGKEDLSFRELNRILLKLEVNGLVRVSRQMKGKRRVEIAEERNIR
jgi:Fe2+ or Zn2+ uptake regulation protein